MTSPRPGYRIVLDGQDITPRINGRLQKLSLTDSRGDEADQLDLTLTDHDGSSRSRARASSSNWRSAG